MWRDAGRGQSIQIGAVLLFGALIIALSGYQAFVVPQQNERVEFSHSQQVQGDLGELRNTLTSTTGGAADRSVSVQLGTRYPARLIAVNPGPATGNLRTEGTTDTDVEFEVANAEADGETGDFWTGSDTRTYETGHLVYRPTYNRYGGAATTIFENSVLVNDFPSGTVTLAGQTLVEDNRISLVALDGQFDRTQTGAATVDVRPVSSSTKTVSVSDSTSPVTLRFPTRLSETTWEDLLSDQLTSNGGHISSVTVTSGSPYDTLEIQFETGETYTLEMARAGVGTGVSATTRAYLTDVSGDGTAIPEGGTQQFVLEVRDRFNNPVSGVTVDAEVDSGDSGTLISGSDTTDADGQVTFTYDPPDDIDGGSESATVYASYEDLPSGGTFDATTTQDADLSLTVMNSDGSGATSGGEDGAYRTTWQDPSGQSGVTCDAEGDDCTLDASQAASVTLTAQTDPEAADAVMRFARNRTDRGTLSTTNTTTDSDGLATTTFTPTTNGETKIYAVSGGSGDVINLTVTGYTSITTTAPDAYNDATSSDSSQDDSIPPTTPLGTLSTFSGFTSDDGTVGMIDEVSQTGGGNDKKQRARVGLRFPSVPSGSHTIEIEYRLVSANGETFELQVVDGNGDEIDTTTDYTLSNTGGLTTESFSLSTTESDWIDSNGVVYVVLEDSQTGNSDSTQTSINVDYIEVRTDTTAALVPVGTGGDGGSGPGSTAPAGRSSPVQTAGTIALVVPVVLVFYDVLRRVRTRGQRTEWVASIPI